MSGAEFVACLQRVGYPGADQLDGNGFDWMFENEAVLPFLEWFCDNINASNVIRSSELKEFDSLAKEDILEGPALEEALQNLSVTEDDQMTDEKWEEEIQQLEDAVKFTEQRKELLVQQRNKLAMHQTALVDRASRMDDVDATVKHDYKVALEQAQEDNRKMNTALSELMSSVQQLMELYENILAAHKSASMQKEKPAVFLSQLDLHTYYSMEDKFGQQLKLFTRKQFFEGIADIASEGEASRYEFLEISRPENLLVRGESDGVNLDECRELQRLQALYPKAKCQQINALVEEKSTQAACQVAEEKLQEMKQAPYPRDVSDLSDRLHDAQTALSIVRRDLDVMANEEVPALIKDSANLQVTKILRGDYDLKIARQDYFTSNQDQLIDQLIIQRGRYEMLMMAYEIEARGHRDTHKLITVASMLLRRHLNAFSDRMRMMKDSSAAAGKHQRETIDSRDKFITSLHSMLADADGRDSKQMFLTYSGLEKNANQLNQDLTSLRASLSSTNSNQDDKLSLLESNLSACESMVYSGSTTNVGKPVLSPQPILDTLTQLEAMLKKLEQAVMDVIKDVDQKKKLLKTDALQNTERELYIYFFNDPDRLRRTLEDLNHRLKALE